MDQDISFNFVFDLLRFQNRSGAFFEPRFFRSADLCLSTLNNEKQKQKTFEHNKNSIHGNENFNIAAD
jgi:hypothetical protein